MYKIDVIGSTIYSDDKPFFDIVHSDGQLIWNSKELTIKWSNYEDDTVFEMKIKNSKLLNVGQLKKKLDDDYILFVLPDQIRGDKKFINIKLDEPGAIHILFDIVDLEVSYSGLEGKFRENV